MTVIGLVELGRVPYLHDVVVPLMRSLLSHHLTLDHDHHHPSLTKEPAMAGLD